MKAFFRKKWLIGLLACSIVCAIVWKCSRQPERAPVIVARKLLDLDIFTIWILPDTVDYPAGPHPVPRDEFADKLQSHVSSNYSPTNAGNGQWYLVESPLAVKQSNFGIRKVDKYHGKDFRLSVNCIGGTYLQKGKILVRVALASPQSKLTVSALTSTGD